MSEKSTPLTAQHFEYIAQHIRPEDEFLGNLKKAAVEAGIPAIWISHEQASFMQILLSLMGARNVLEIGCLAGYSAIMMARALPKAGKVQSIEISKEHADFARTWIAKSDVAGRIEVLRGDASQILPTLQRDSVDAVFIDADKDHYELYLDQCTQIVRRGGLIMVDNAMAFGQLLDDDPEDPDVAHIRRFNETIAHDKRLQSIIVPLGDGCWVGIRRQ